jgi:UDP-glucose 4-epimerase
MRVVVTGASGNVGTSLIRAFADAPEVDEVVGLARRLPQIKLPKTSWAQADVRTSDLVKLFAGADAVVHLAWLIQPTRNPSELRATNVEGSARVFHAAGTAGVPTVVHASSVGVYSPGPKETRVDESWPTDGIETSAYSRHKVEAERLLDRFEAEHTAARVVRLRPALIFKRAAAMEIRRFFVGPFLPNALVRRGLIPLLPYTDDLRFQGVHSHDIGEAYRLAVTSQDARGAYNVAAEPVLDPGELSRILRARPVRVPGRVLRAAADVTWRLRLQPTDASWVDLALQSPLLDTRRVREELGWTPRHTASEAFAELLDGLREGAGFDTPPLDPDAGGPMRLRELATGVGRKSG